WRAPGAGIGAIERDGWRARLEALAAQVREADPTPALARALAEAGLEGYGALPEGAAPEAGALARGWDVPEVAAARAAHGAGLAARLAASRHELLALPGRMAEALAAIEPAPARAAKRADGPGRAVVETARGPLTHALRLTAGRVADYSTAAPTEVNFAPRGPALAGLSGARAEARAAELHMIAIDPCVACRVEIVPL
ncbi:MAG: hypothetical protein D6801_01120, partial [Alphaproteobacteria bacterium]